jgi:Amt family ammonium transporter
MASIVMGLVAGAVCLLAIGLKNKMKYDDSLDVIAVHLVGGLLGSIMLGLFAETSINGLVVDEGLFVGGGADLLIDQIVASAAVLAFSFVASLIIAKVIDVAIGLRISPDQELEGLDRSQHAETAYVLGELGGSSLGAPVGQHAPLRPTVDA